MDNKPHSGDNAPQGLSWSTPEEPKPAPVFAGTPMPERASEQKKGTEQTSYRKLIIIGIIGFAVGIALVWGWSRLGTQVPSGADAGTSEDGNIGQQIPEDAVLDASASLTVAPAQVAGSQVAITSAVVTEPTWVVVYDDLDGQPGTALGAQLFFPGTAAGTVTLVRETKSGISYIVGMQKDNGDYEYIRLVDAPIVDVSGKRILSSFTAH